MNKKAPTPLGERVKRVREACDVSARTLSALAGLSNSAIGQLESGAIQELRAEATGNLAAAFGVSLDWLVRGDEPEPDMVAVRARVRAAADALKAEVAA